MITCFHLWTARCESKIQPTAFLNVNAPSCFVSSTVQKEIHAHCFVQMVNASLGLWTARLQQNFVSTCMAPLPSHVCVCQSQRLYKPPSLLIEVHIHVTARMYTYTYTYMYAMNVYIHTVRCMLYIHIHTYTCIDIYTQNTYIYIYIYIYGIYTCMYTENTQGA